MDPEPRGQIADKLARNVLQTSSRPDGCLFCVSGVNPDPDPGSSADGEKTRQLTGEELP